VKITDYEAIFAFLLIGPNILLKTLFSNILKSVFFP